MNNYHLVFISTDINDMDKKYRTQYIYQNDLKWLKEDLEINKKKHYNIFTFWNS